MPASGGEPVVPVRQRMLDDAPQEGAEMTVARDPEAWGIAQDLHDGVLDVVHGIGLLAELRPQPPMDVRPDPGKVPFQQDIEARLVSGLPTGEQREGVGLHGIQEPRLRIPVILAGRHGPQAGLALRSERSQGCREEPPESMSSRDGAAALEEEGGPESHPNHGGRAEAQGRDSAISRR